MATTEFDSAVEQQRMSALEYANVIRVERAQWRREVKRLSCEDGRHRVAELLLVMPVAIRSAKIGNLLLWPQHTGDRRVVRWLKAADCRDWLRVENLTERQRVSLIDLLRA